jgi:ribosomal protein L22
MTEKNYNAQQRTGKTMKKQQKAEKTKTEQKKTESVKKEEIKKEEMKAEKEGTKIEEKKEEKKPVQKKEKIRKDEASVNGISLPLSTLDSIYICNFIRKKPVQKAIVELEEVLKFKKAIPMKGEIPHRKGKGMMSGRYPINAVKVFIKLLKSLQANANVNGLEEPIIAEAIANKASQPYGRFGRIRRKRAHVKIKAVEKKLLNKNKKRRKK